ncbi:esterase/lipase family protein [Streptomyces sp. NPDC002306]
MKSARRAAVWIGAVALSVTASLASTAATSAAAINSSRDPVIFIHGYTGSAWNWSLMIDDFETAGYPSSMLYNFTYDWKQSNVITASQLASLVDAVRTRTGHSKVDIVSHSMGGLSSRWYLKFMNGTSYVDDWVSLGGPNHGTNLAQACSVLHTSCTEMRSTDSFLTILNSGDETPGNVNYGTFWSSCDEIVNPDSSTLLSGASNVSVGCVEHGWLMFSSRVSDLVRRFVS